MKINSINNKTTFGYNKALNKKLENKLKSEPTDLNQTLLELNSLCNKTEDMIDARIKKDAPAIETEILISLFFNIKPTLTNIIETNYPNFNYTDRELQNYQIESRQGNKYWKQNMLNLISQTQETTENINLPIKNTAPPKGFDEIPGRKKLKETLNAKIITPLTSTANIENEQYGKNEIGSILLYGPPGCDKEDMAKAIAKEAKLPLFNINLELDNPNTAEEQLAKYQSLFNQLSSLNINENKKCILFLNGVDNLYMPNYTPGSFIEKTPQVKEILSLISNASKNGLIIVSTSDSESLEAMKPQIKESFDDFFLVDLPGQTTIKEMLKKDLTERPRGSKLKEDNAALSEIAAKLANFPDKSIKKISHYAAVIAQSEEHREITKDDYLKSIEEHQDLKSKFGPTTSRKIGFKFKNEKTVDGENIE